jgi:hypothetical protein
MNPVIDPLAHDVYDGPSAAPASAGDGRALGERRDLERRLDALRSAFLGVSVTRARIPLERVDLELWRVHQIEAARALAEAARLADRPDDGDDVRAWHARARELIESARACEARLPRVLARCARCTREKWPSPQRLLRAALRLDPSEALRAELRARLETSA